MKKKGRYQSSTTHISLSAILLCVALIIIGILICLLLRKEPVMVETPNGISATELGNVEKNTDTISIPGYEGISLIANSKQQTLGFPNPEKNTCYFQISMYLDDGTLLWQSDLVEPGKVSDPILLTQELAAGTYTNAVLKYDCYTMDGTMTLLNGATTKLLLWIK